ncbi:MAG: hypothetical protein IT473_04105 [Lysobacter sp.]|nr:hypothetical protein [Lysobacter sp.]
MEDTRKGPGHTFELTLLAESHCLIANVTGWIETIDAIIALFAQIGAALRRTHCTRLLVLDHTRGVVPPEHEMKALMSAMEGRGFESVRTAYVDMRGTAISRMEVGEILGRERGYDCRVFDNEHRARIWLNYGND